MTQQSDATECFAIDALDAEGAGLFRRDGEVESLEGALPGDRVALAGRDLRLIPESPHRQRPGCAHFSQCGGCQLQHATDDFVAEWKRRKLEIALRRQGVSAPVLPTETVPAGTRRRAVFSAERTKKTVRLGFRARKGHEIIDIASCPVIEPDLAAGLPAFRALARLAASRKGVVRIAAATSLNGLDVAVSEGKNLDLALREQAGALAEDFALARLSWNGEVVAARVPALQRFGAASVIPPAGAFLQASRDGEAILARLIREALARRGVTGAARVIELFAGCGTFTLPMAEIAEIHAFEGDKALVAALDAGWRGATGLRRVRAEARDLFRRPLLTEEFAGAGAIVFDPPRAGAEAQVREIARSGVTTVIGVSCNPVSFARDARILEEGGYRLGPVTPVDQFRWSPHVELVGVFER